MSTTRRALLLALGASIPVAAQDDPALDAPATTAEGFEIVEFRAVRDRVEATTVGDEIQHYLYGGTRYFMSVRATCQTLMDRARQTFGAPIVLVDETVAGVRVRGRFAVQRLRYYPQRHEWLFDLESADPVVVDPVPVPDPDPAATGRRGFRL